MPRTYGGAEEVGLQLRLVDVEAYARSPLKIKRTFVIGDRMNTSNRSGQPVTLHDDGLDPPASMPTIGWFRWVPPIEPRNGALKEKMPPSEATSQ